MIRSDHRIEFENSKLDGFCVDKGIHQKIFAPRNLQQNGVVDMKNRTLVEIGRTMLIVYGLVKNFRVEVVNTVCYMTNRCLIKSPKKQDSL